MGFVRPYTVAEVKIVRLSNPSLSALLIISTPSLLPLLDFSKQLFAEKILREFFRQHTDQSIIVIHLCSCVPVLAYF